MLLTNWGIILACIWHTCHRRLQVHFHLRLRHLFLHAVQAMYARPVLSRREMPSGRRPCLQTGHCKIAELKSQSVGGVHFLSTAACASPLCSSCFSCLQIGRPRKLNFLIGRINWLFASCCIIFALICLPSAATMCAATAFANLSSNCGTARMPGMFWWIPKALSLRVGAFVARK